MEEADLVAVPRQVQAQVVDQLEGGGGQVDVGLGAFQQGQLAIAHRPRRAGKRAQAEVIGFAIVQLALVGRGQPGVGEAPGQPAFRGLDQAFLGHFLDSGEQWQVQLVGRDIAGNQLEHGIATVLPALAHHQPVVAALEIQGQPHRNAEVRQFHREAPAVVHLYRPSALQHLREVQRPPQALVAQRVGTGFDMQWEGLECAGVLAGEDSRHVGSFWSGGG
ncbi:hypothetical protein D3C78_696480 [compost metagenome]